MKNNDNPSTTALWNRMRRWSFLPILLLSITLESRWAFADEAVSEVELPDRVLGGHTFIPSGIIPDPFIHTRFGSLTGIGMGTLTVNESVGNMTAGDYKLAVFGLGLDVQIGIGDWVGLRARMDGNILSGINGDGIMNFGANLGYNFGGGIVVRVLRVGPFQWSVSGDFAQDNSIGINPGPVIQELMNSGSLSLDRLVANQTSYGFAAGTQAALALHKSLGVWLSTSYKQTFPEDQGGQELLAGLGWSFDLYPLISVPLGFGAHYQLSKSLKNDGLDPSHQFGGGVFVTGRENLALGLEVDVFRRSFGTIASTLAFTGAFVMRYYW